MGGALMRENKANVERTFLHEDGRDQFRRIMNERDQVRRIISESGEPAPVDMAQFSRRTGQIIARAAVSDRRDQP
jgi:hypothetical protein